MEKETIDILTDSEKKELQRYIDDFMYHIEDNFFTKIDQIKELKIAMKELDKLWDKIGGGRT